jgi:hypothetical protein
VNKMVLCEGCGQREGKKTQLGEYLCNFCISLRNNIRNRRTPSGVG